jgi:leucyl-tRNA synthetase
MFMGPLEQSKPWSMQGVGGVRGFLDRLWRLHVDHLAEELTLNAAVQDVPPTDEQLRVLHKTIKVVTRNLENLEFNTAIARLMEFVNFFTAETTRPKSVLEQFLLLVSPLAPHICEELWQLLGHNHTLAYEPWPQFDEALTRESSIEIPVQVRGKVRGKITVPADATEEQLVEAAKAEPKVAELISGKEIAKTVVVKGKMVNFVVK